MGGGNKNYEKNSGETTSPSIKSGLNPSDSRTGILELKKKTGKPTLGGKITP